MSGESVTVTLEDARPGDVVRAASGNRYRLVAVLPGDGHACRPRYVVDAEGELLRLDGERIRAVERQSYGTVRRGRAGLVDVRLLVVQTSPAAEGRLS